VGSLSLAVELRKLAAPETKKDLHSLVKEKLDYLVTSRPTAVKMQLGAEACVKLPNDLVDKASVDAAEVKDVIVKHLEAMLANDIADNLAIGEHGARDIAKKCGNKDKLRVLTHCNTGSLATAYHHLNTHNYRTS